MSSGAHAMKRIPRIKFPQRHPKPAGSESSPPADQKAAFQPGLALQPERSSSAPSYRFRSNVPPAPSSTAVGGKASLLPKRTPLSEEEIEAILLGGCF